MKIWPSKRGDDRTLFQSIEDRRAEVSARASDYRNNFNWVEHRKARRYFWRDVWVKTLSEEAADCALAAYDARFEEEAKQP